MLVLLQLLGSLAAGVATAHAQGREAGAAIASAPICRAVQDGLGRHGSAPSEGFRHCGACILGCDTPQGETVARIAALAAPPASAAMVVAPALCRCFVAAAGWRSSWSSRAPPVG